jgi:putative transposase
LKHHVYDTRLKNLMERLVQQIKDRTECFDDHFPCTKQNCNRQHVWNWLKLFILYLDMDKDRMQFITFLVLEGR